VLQLELPLVAGVVEFVAGVFCVEPTTLRESSSSSSSGSGEKESPVCCLAAWLSHHVMTLYVCVCVNV